MELVRGSILYVFGFFGWLSIFFTSCNVMFVQPPAIGSWQTSVITCIWLIWIMQNKLIFDVTITYTHMASTQLEVAIHKANNFVSTFMHNSIDDLIRLHALGILGRLCQALHIIPIVWRPLPSGWIKVNTDGSSLELSRLSSSGGFPKLLRVCIQLFHTNSWIRICIQSQTSCGNHDYYDCFSQRMALALVRVGFHLCGVFPQQKICDSLVESQSSLTTALSLIENMTMVAYHIFRKGNHVVDPLSKAPVGCSQCQP